MDSFHHSKFTRSPPSSFLLPPSSTSLHPYCFLQCSSSLIIVVLQGMQVRSLVEPVQLRPPPEQSPKQLLRLWLLDLFFADVKFRQSLRSLRTL